MYTRTSAGPYVDGSDCEAIWVDVPMKNMNDVYSFLFFLSLPLTLWACQTNGTELLQKTVFYWQRIRCSRSCLLLISIISSLKKPTSPHFSGIGLKAKANMEVPNHAVPQIATWGRMAIDSHPSFFRVAGGLKPIQAVLGQEAGCTLDRSLFCHRANT